jgi:hypothetical protein
MVAPEQRFPLVGQAVLVGSYDDLGTNDGMEQKSGETV